MLTKEQAVELVLKRIADEKWIDEPIEVVDEVTIEKSYGWVFFYNTKTYLETRQISHALAGNGPVIVNKYDGTIEFFGTNRPVEASIAEYEKRHAT